MHVQGYLVSGGCVSTTVFGRDTNKSYSPLFSLLFCSLTLAASAAPVSYEYPHSLKPYTSTPNV